jgi:hypothetical protein
MITVSHRTKLELDTIEAGRLVAQVLQEDFDFLSKEIIELKSKSKLSDVQMEDLNNDLHIRDAMRTLLQYYMTHNEYREFMELQRVYGNVA